MPDMNTAMEGAAKPAPGGGTSPVLHRRPGSAVTTRPGFVLWSFTATTFGCTSAAATDTIWLGAMSISWTVSGVTSLNSPL